MGRMDNESCFRAPGRRSTAKTGDYWGGDAYEKVNVVADHGFYKIFYNFCESFFVKLTSTILNRMNI